MGLTVSYFGGCINQYYHVMMGPSSKDHLRRLFITESIQAIRQEDKGQYNGNASIHGLIGDEWCPSGAKALKFIVFRSNSKYASLYNVFTTTLS